MIFICNNCGFLFERTSEPDQCPDCGKENIEAAKTEDQIKYMSKKQMTGKENRGNRQ